ncbi:HAD family phosphatase [Mesorhizobium sp. SB112]|uniref:HAD family hydrolase n=1 Tax=Mesorhizobium sp. SB112 TaxID=3151853 RepID=UPI00326719EF
MTVKAVYWDMDGTLIDSEPLHEECLAIALRSVGVEPPSDLHDKIIGIAARPVYDLLRAEYGFDLPFDQWIGIKYAHYLSKAASLKARSGALEIFLELKAKGVVQAVVSNSDRLVVDTNMRALDIHEPAFKSVSRNDVRLGKPDAEPYLRAAYLTGIDPTHTIVMEDSRTGASAGVAAGMKTLLWPQQKMEPLSGALYIENLEDVRAELGL